MTYRGWGGDVSTKFYTDHRDSLASSIKLCVFALLLLESWEYTVSEESSFHFQVLCQCFLSVMHTSTRLPKLYNQALHRSLH